MPDTRASAEFAHYLDELGRLRRRERRPVPENLVVLERVESTNLLGRRIVAEYERESVRPPAAADPGAASRPAAAGGSGRSWSSPPGKGVYATLVLPVESAELLQTLPLLVGVGLCRGLEQHLPSPAGSMAERPAAGGRKIGGILIESVVQRARRPRRSSASASITAIPPRTCRGRAPPRCTSRGCATCRSRP